MVYGEKETVEFSMMKDVIMKLFLVKFVIKWEADCAAWKQSHQMQLAKWNNYRRSKLEESTTEYQKTVMKKGIWMKKFWVADG